MPVIAFATLAPVHSRPLATPGHGVCMRAKPSGSKKPAGGTTKKNKAAASTEPKASSKAKPAPTPPSPSPSARFALHPAPAFPHDVVEQHYPRAGRNLAPHIVFLSNTAIALDNMPVHAPALPSDDDAAPDAALFSAHFPKPGDTLNHAPHIDLAAPHGSVSVTMSPTGAAAASGGPTPDEYAPHYPAAYRNLSPHISVSHTPGRVGVSMQAPAASRHAGADAAVDPSAYAAQFPDGAGLNMAPHVSVSDGVVKVEMARVAVDADAQDRPRFDGFPQYAGQAPVLEFSGEGDERGIRCSMGDAPSFASLHAAPVISFDGVRGVSVGMQTIVGDASAVDCAKMLEDPLQATYTTGWRPRSSLATEYV